MPGVTIKVSAATRDRICLMAAREHRTMGALVEEALECYARTLRQHEYLEGWKRFREERPEEFEKYRSESQEIDFGFSEPMSE